MFEPLLIELTAPMLTALAEELRAGEAVTGIYMGADRQYEARLGCGRLPLGHLKISRYLQWDGERWIETAQPR